MQLKLMNPQDCAGMTDKKNNLIWIDLEMTGLDTVRDEIIEIATIVTDAQLTILAEGPIIAIHQPDSVLEGMDEWNTRQHGQSGLSQRVRDSAFTVQDAERMTLDFLAQHVDAKASPMCGNSICQDRRFMARLMPELEAFFHYRNLDVSTLKELGRRWAPQLTAGFNKTSSHLAMDDIRDSINELIYYREHLFKPFDA
jgi:oligoribonuclease